MSGWRRATRRKAGCGGLPAAGDPLRQGSPPPAATRPALPSRRAGDRSRTELRATAPSVTACQAANPGPGITARGGGGGWRGEAAPAPLGELGPAAHWPCPGPSVPPGRMRRPLVLTWHRRGAAAAGAGRQPSRAAQDWTRQDCRGRGRGQRRRRRGRAALPGQGHAGAGSPVPPPPLNPPVASRPGAVVSPQRRGGCWEA